jgi:hypothetical protein
MAAPLQRALPVEAKLTSCIHLSLEHAMQVENHLHAGHAQPENTRAPEAGEFKGALTKPCIVQQIQDTVLPRQGLKRRASASSRIEHHCNQ